MQVPPLNGFPTGQLPFLPLPFDGPLRAGRGVLTWGCRPPQNAPLHPPLLPLPKHGASTVGDKEAPESEGARGGEWRMSDDGRPLLSLAALVTPYACWRVRWLLTQLFQKPRGDSMQGRESFSNEEPAATL